MHGCPPDEIERISRYLIDERGLHTLGQVQPHAAGRGARARHHQRGPGLDATCPSRTRPSGTTCATRTRVPMFQRLRAAADERGLVFGLKLSNTLEVQQLAHRLRSRRHDVPVRPGAPRRDRQPGRHAVRRVRRPAAPLLRGRRRRLQHGPPPGGRPAHGDGLLRPAQDRRLPAPAAVPRAGRGGHSRPSERADIDDFVHADGPGRRARTATPWPRLRAPTCAATPTRCGTTGATARTPSAPTAPRRPARWAPSTASSRPAWTSAPSTRPCRATWPPCAPATSPRRCA